MGNAGGRTCSSISNDTSVKDMQIQQLQAEIESLKQNKEGELAGSNNNNNNSNNNNNDTSLFDEELRKKEEEIQKLKAQLQPLERLKEYEDRLKTLEKERGELEKRLELSDALTQKQREKQEFLQTELNEKKKELEKATEDLESVRSNLKEVEDKQMNDVKNINDEERAKSPELFRQRIDSDAGAALEALNRLSQLESIIDNLKEEGSKSIAKQIAELENEIHDANLENDEIDMNLATSTTNTTIVSTNVQSFDDDDIDNELGVNVDNDLQIVDKIDDLELESNHTELVVDKLAADSLWSDDDDATTNDKDDNSTQQRSTPQQKTNNNGPVQPLSLPTTDESSLPNLGNKMALYPGSPNAYTEDSSLPNLGTKFALDPNSSIEMERGDIKNDNISSAAQMLDDDDFLNDLSGF